MKILIGFCVVCYIAGSLSLVGYVSFHMMIVEGPGKYINWILLVLVPSWIILVIGCLTDFTIRDWHDEIERELWRTILIKRFMTWGISLGVIIYYIRIIREHYRDRQSMKLPNAYINIQRLYMDILSSVQYILQYLMVIAIPILIVGFYLKSDILFLGAFKGFAGIFAVSFISGMPYNLIILNDICRKEWTDDSFMEYIDDFDKYYRNIYRGNLI